MSYIAYLNGEIIDIDLSKPIAQTRQVNDLARLDNRNSNFTNTLKLPMTARNIRVMDSLNLSGNGSNLPYQKNSFDLIDADTGKHLIYKGWATIKKTTGKYYEVYVYDGIIDFYRAIENKTLTNAGISDLNHLKNLTSVVNSFANTLPYMYIISDYNGNNFCKTNNIGQFNIDYQVPSARVSYLWDRVFDYAGFTYTGSVFATDAFLDLFMTFPKPVPVLTPVTELVTDQDSIFISFQTVNPTPNGGIEYVTITRPVFLPNYFDTAYIDSTPTGITVQQTGSYRFSFDGEFLVNGVSWTQIYISAVNSSGQTVYSNTIEIDQVPEVIIALSVGDRISIGTLASGTSDSINHIFISGLVHTKIELLLGYDANFENVLIDFKITDFVNEILQRFGLTMFKDKYTNNIDFKTVDEILEDNTPLDWSKYFVSKESESYTIGNYAKKNYFRYRYNDDNSSYNDGFFTVNNENLKDEVTVLKSITYSPEQKKVELFGDQVNVYKIWDKEIKDDNTVEYKELNSRFYFLKYQAKTISTQLASDTLNTITSVSSIMIDNYDRMKMQEVIYDNYSSIESILDKSKALTAKFNLSLVEVDKFDFKKLIYVDKLGSYYMVNKIPNFVKGNLSSIEMIEVDYRKQIAPPVDVVYYLTITNTVLNNDCTVTFAVDTNIPQPIDVTVIAVQPPIVFTSFPEYLITGTLSSNTITIPISSLPNSGASGYNLYSFKISVYNVTPFINIISTPVNLNLTDSCYIAPPALLTYITITNINTYAIVGNVRKVRIDFITDLVLPAEIKYNLRDGYLDFIGVFGTFGTISENFILIDLQHTNINDSSLKIHGIRIGADNGSNEITYSNLVYSNS